MSRRHRHNTEKVSLFPFLDVLVCTMGSLILLLLVATSRIRTAAVEQAKQAAMQERLKSEEIPTPVPPPIVANADPEPEDNATPEWQTRVEQLTGERDALRDQLSQLKNGLATAQSAAMRTKVKAASTEDRLKEIRTQQEAAASERQQMQAEIDSLQSDLTDAELRLAKAAERQKTAKSKFAFLPFDGRTGTTKRPILIECTQDYIRFLPEDVRLTPADLNGFTSGFNPLLIASRELVYYWKAYERVHSADADPAKESEAFESELAALNDREREPYVLLLVRPNGAVAFHIAKGLLSQLKVPHGYELITDDMEIDSSNPDPEAKQICQAAVTQVLAERDKLTLALARNRDQQREQLQLDPEARTFVPKETDGSATGFNRPKSIPRPLGSGSDRPSGPLPNGRGTDSLSNTAKNGASETGGLKPNGARSVSGTALAVGDSRENVDPESPVAIAKPLKASTGGLTPPARQQRAGGSQVAQTGRPQLDDEPSEEPLPQSNARRYENDDSKPFPFNGERAKPAPSKDAGPAASANKSNTPRPSSRPSNDPRAANNSTNGSASNGNLAKMKRRYLMPRSGIGLEKAITIRISFKRVMIGGEYEIPVEAGVRTESLIDRVLIAMDRVQSGWPSAGEGYHWVPTIKYEVIPGGEQTHQRLNSALFDLGLQSNVEYLDSDPDVGQAASQPRQKRQAGSLPYGGGGAR